MRLALPRVAPATADPAVNMVADLLVSTEALLKDKVVLAALRQVRVAMVDLQARDKVATADLPVVAMVSRAAILHNNREATLLSSKVVTALLLHPDTE